MNLRALLHLVAASSLAAACANYTPVGAGLGDTCLSTTDCAEPYICLSGRCAPPFGQLCTPAQYRCNGDYTERCSDSGDAWETREHCDIGCVQGACLPAICAAGDQKCQGNTIMQCLPKGVGWAFVETCVTSCAQDPVNERARLCTEPACVPYQTACDENDPTKIKTCNPNGTAFNPSQPCGAGKVCSAGQCLPSVCGGSRERCNGTVAEACNEDGTGWDVKPNGYCQNGCLMVDGAATCPPQICVPFSTQCTMDGTAVQVCNSMGTAWSAGSTCTSSAPLGAVCVGGTCRDAICSADTQRCQGNLLQQCNSSGTAWDTTLSCQFSCVATSSTAAACGPAACAAGEQRCCQPGDASCTAPNGNLLEICTPDRSGFAFVQYCATGCNRLPNTSPPKAACQVPQCAPLERKCGTDPDTNRDSVLVCLADGTGFQQVEVCSQECLGGVCQRTDTACTPGEFRCQLDEVQTCVQGTNSMAWEFVDHCLGGCSEGVCLPGGACGLTATSAAPITMNVLLPAAAQPNTGANPLPCNDSVTLSKFIISTAPITDSTGVVVPDGTMVTFTHDHTGGADDLILSADADPSTPGIQRPTIDGIAIAVLSAPSSSNCSTTATSTQGQRTVTVTASIAGSCSGALPVYFAQVPGHTNYVAEDFSSTAHEDGARTTGFWDTSLSAAGRTPNYDLGDCRDGTLTITGNPATYNLTDSGFMDSWNVTWVGAQSVLLDDAADSLSTGDEVLVATIWGPANSTAPGAYAFHHVATVDNSSGFSRVTFTEPIVAVFGNGSNMAIAGHRVVLQRVPHFRDLDVPTTTILTAPGITATGCDGSGNNCFPGGGTGILAFRACGQLTVRKEISMDLKGLPQKLSSYPTVTQTASMSRMVMGLPNTTSGSGPTTSGSGIVYIAAKTVSFPTGSATIHSSNTTSGAGGGGVVWLSGASLTFGSTTRVVAKGNPNILTGAARVDASDLSIQQGTSLMDSQLVTAGQNAGKVGPWTVQTSILYPNLPGGLLAGSLKLAGIMGGSGFTTTATAAAPGTQLIEGVKALQVSLDGGNNWALLDSGAASASTLSADVRFQLSLAPPTDKKLLVRAVAFSVTF